MGALKSEQLPLTTPLQHTLSGSLNAVSKTAIPQNKRKQFLPSKLRPVSIDIPYRADGDGKGAFFDHYTIQKSTGRATRIAVADQQRYSHLGNYINGQPYNLPYSQLHPALGKTYPQLLDRDKDELGLLIITGRINAPEDPLRIQYEKSLIKKAQLKGRPVLAICGGLGGYGNLLMEK